MKTYLKTAMIALAFTGVHTVAQADDYERSMSCVSEAEAARGAIETVTVNSNEVHWVFRASEQAVMRDLVIEIAELDRSIIRESEAVAFIINEGMYEIHTPYGEINYDFNEMIKIVFDPFFEELFQYDCYPISG